MKRWLAFFVPFALVGAVGLLGMTVWSWRSGPCTEHVEVAFFDLEPSTRCVRVAGMAHYEVVVTQTVPGNGFFTDRTYYVYALFPPGNTTEREVRVLVRTEREPERMVSFEDMVISGRVVPMNHTKVPFDTETRMGQRGGYYFNERTVLLEPERIEVDGEPTWVAP